jgi:surface antigen
MIRTHLTPSLMAMLLGTVALAVAILLILLRLIKRKQAIRATRTRVFISLLLLSLILVAVPGMSTSSLAGPDADVTPTPSADDTSEWQTYTDADYEFSVRYPQEWNASITLQHGPERPEYVIRRRVTFYGPEHAVINIDVWDNESGLGLMEWFNDHQRPFLSEEEEIPSRPNAEVAGVPAVLVVEPHSAQAPGRVSTVLQKHPVTFRVEYIASDGGSFQDLYKHVLSSFEFAGAQATPDVLPPLPYLSVLEVQLLGDQSCCDHTDPQPNPYYCLGGNCTWWAAYRRSDLPYKNQGWGMASNWTGRAFEEGFLVNDTPATGAIGGKPRSGYENPNFKYHVAVVESFDGSTIHFSDMDYGAWDCEVDRWPQQSWSGIEFIHGACCCRASARLLISQSSASGDSSIAAAQEGPAPSTAECALSVPPSERSPSTSLDEADSIPFVIPSATPTPTPTPDTIPPIGSLAINNGAPTTRGLAVTLSVSADDGEAGVSQMRFSRDGANWSDWEGYRATRTWQLTNSEGTETVYAQLRDEVGNVSSVYSASITVGLNATKPSSANYRLVKSVFGTGGGPKASSGYRLRSTSGQPMSVGRRESSSYVLRSGYWSGPLSAAYFDTYLPLILKDY